MQSISAAHQWHQVSQACCPVQCGRCSGSQQVRIQNHYSKPMLAPASASSQVLETAGGRVKTLPEALQTVLSEGFAEAEQRRFRPYRGCWSTAAHPEERPPHQHLQAGSPCLHNLTCACLSNACAMLAIKAAQPAACI